MSACSNCGADLFIGETKCPSCRAPVPHAAETARAAGVEPDTSATGPLPPDGLNLIVQQGLNDREAWHDRDDTRYDVSMDGDGYGVSFGPSMDLSDAMKVERDARGNVVWDMKYALVGAVVVALFVTLAAVLFVMNVNQGKQLGSKYSTVSDVRIHR